MSGKRRLNFICTIALALSISLTSLGVYGLINLPASQNAEIEEWPITPENEVGADEIWIEADAIDGTVDSAHTAVQALDILDYLLQEDIDLEAGATDVSGDMTFYRTDQLYDGVPVFGRGATLITDTDGTIIGANSNCIAIGELSTDTALTSRQAQDAAEAHFIKRGYDLNNIRLSDKGLSIYSIDTEPTLCRLFFGNGGNALDLSQAVFVDLQTGAIAATFDNILLYKGQDGYDHQDLPTEEVSGQLTLQDSERKIYIYSLGYTEPGFSNLPKDSQSLATINNPAAVDAMVSMIATYDFYKDVLGRSQYDGNPNTNMNVYVNYLSPVWMLNAMWITKEQVMCFTIGHESTKELSSLLDIVAHEFTHAVTEYTAGLLYISQSAVIDEALSDIMGECVEKYTTGENDWKMGADGEEADYQVDQTEWPGGIRDFTNGRDKVFAPGGEVHENSKILTYIAYLIGSGQEIPATEDHGVFTPEETRFFNNTKAGGKEGVETYARFWYRVQLSLLPTATFQQFATVAVRIAEAMYDKGEITEAQFEGIKAAFAEKGYIVSPNGKYQTELDTEQKEATGTVLADESGTIERNKTSNVQSFSLLSLTSDFKVLLGGGIIILTIVLLVLNNRRPRKP